MPTPQSQYGWPKDNHGISCQSIATAPGKVLGSGEAKKTTSVMVTLLSVTKMEIRTLEKGFDRH